MQDLRLEFDHYCKGAVRDLQMDVTVAFKEKFGDSLQFIDSQLISTHNRTVPMVMSLKDRHSTATAIHIPQGTCVAVATRRVRGESVPSVIQYR